MKSNQKLKRNISPRQQSTNERDKMFAEFNILGFSTKKLTQIESLNMSKSTVKRKRRQLRKKGFIERKPGSGRPKIIDLQKGEFILNQLQKNVFLSGGKIKKKTDWWVWRNED